MPAQVKVALFARVVAGLLGRLGLLLLPGCEAASVETAFVEPTSSRPYRVITRAGHDAGRPAPVLFALHAYATEPDVLVLAYGLTRDAVGARGFILVLPEGFKDDTNHRFWNASLACCEHGTEHPDDVAYLRGVLADVKRSYAVDAERVYALGVSNGGFMAHRWACAGGGDLRGIVSVSGMGSGPGDPPCAASVPVSVLQVHGTADRTVHYGGGERVRGRYPSAQGTVKAWCERNGCDGAPRTAREWFLFSSTITTETWHGPRAKVALWTVEGGDHRLGAVRRMTPSLLDFLDGG